MKPVAILLLLIMIGCSGHKQPEADYVVEVLDLALKLSYYDFAIDPVDEYFSPQELDWFVKNRSAAENIIVNYVDRGSTSAILLAGYLRLDSALKPLRRQLLKLRGPYGWEGPDYSKEEAWLYSGQYPYHNIYIDAIERITQKPIHESIKLTPSEYNSLQRESRRARTFDTFPDVGNSPPYIDGNAWCAKWLLIQLKLLEN
ncbi:MAG: hypothetical protein OXM61_23880 [Candidatus Poribacteria bacterium]|nr:hypothetical protein [Candidatus Poribacteria bacterium]